MNANFWRAVAAPVLAMPNRAAFGYMMLSTAGFSAMNIFVRLAGEQMGAPLVVTLRNLVTLLLLLPFVAPNGFAIIRTNRLKDHFYRSVVGAVGMITWTYSITLIPLGHATALSFTAPLLVTVFAMLFLKEHVHKRQYWALAAGFLGTLIILRPSVAGFDLNSLWVIFAACAWAVTSIFIKSLSNTEPPLRMVFYMNFFMFLVALPLGFTQWQMPSFHGWLLLLGISVCSIVMHLSMVRAYARAPVVTLMPFDFVRLVYTALLAYIVFGETSDGWTWVGAAIIIGSAIYNAGRDAKVTAPE